MRRTEGRLEMKASTLRGEPQVTGEDVDPFGDATATPPWLGTRSLGARGPDAWGLPGPSR